MCQDFYIGRFSLDVEKIGRIAQHGNTPFVLVMRFGYFFIAEVRAGIIG